MVKMRFCSPLAKCNRLVIIQRCVDHSARVNEQHITLYLIGAPQ